MELLIGLIAVAILSTNAVKAELFMCPELKEMFSNECDCFAYENTNYPIIDCSNKNLDSIPPLVNPSNTYKIYELRLNENQIKRIEADAFSGLNIERLDLSNNAIETVSEYAFRNITTSLISLKLDGDSIAKPPKQALRGFHSNILEELTLRNYNLPILGGENNQDEGAQIFLAFTNLRKLSIVNWNLSVIEGLAFTGLTELESLRLEDNPFETVPTSLNNEGLDNLKTLIIKGSKIELIPPYAFHTLIKLTDLDLTNNQIYKFEQGCFLFDNTDSSIEHLHIGGQKSITNLDLSGLKGLPKLKTLDISNQLVLTTFPDLSLLDASALEVDLSKTGITTLSGLSKPGIIKSLKLAETRLVSMADNVFEKATSLEELVISGGITNKIEIPSSLTAAKTLKKLQIYNIEIKTHSLWPVLQELSNLEHIDLTRTNLRSIPENVFFELVKLKRVDLVDNHIESLTPRTLAGPKDSLKYIDLSFNTLSTLPECMFDGFTTTVKLALEEVLFDCDCTVDWLSDEIISGRVEFVENKEPKCRDGDTIPPQSPRNCDKDICENLYQTTPSSESSQTDSEEQNIYLEIKIENIGINYIEISWSATNSIDITKYSVKATSSGQTTPYEKNDISRSLRTLLIEPLDPDTTYTICVEAYIDSKLHDHNCKNERTKESKETAEKQSGSDDNLPIIVGVTIGGILLFVVIIAIIYLVWFRRKPQKGGLDRTDAPVQPRHFEKSELPAMGDDSRRFVRAKIPPGKAEGMQVVAISDGQTSNGRVGRAEQLDPAYKFMGSSRGNSSLYENDHGPLPPTPSSSNTYPPNYSSYYNQGFRSDHYDEPSTSSVEVTI